MRKREMSSVAGFERLELRRLLAADGCLQALPEIANSDPVACEMAAFDCAAEEANSEAAIDPPSAEADRPALNRPDPRTLDLADGMDGYFGNLDAGNPAETLEFTATEDGRVQVNLFDSTNATGLRLLVTNGQGDVVTTRQERLNGFDRLDFEVVEGETYQVSISSEDSSCEVQFQVTAGFQRHVDQHADQRSDESTVLEIVDHAASVDGRLESAGDVDTFRFAASATGEATLQLQETADDTRIALQVRVHDGAGNLLTEGQTNERLQNSFDVQAGEEYFVTISAGEGQSGTYRFAVELSPAADANTVEDAEGQINGPSVDPGVGASQDSASNDADVTAEGDDPGNGDENSVDLPSDPADPDKLAGDTDAACPPDVLLDDDQSGEGVAADSDAGPVPAMESGEILAEAAVTDNQTVDSDSALLSNEPVVASDQPVDEGFTVPLADCQTGTEPAADPETRRDSDSAEETTGDALAGQLVSIADDAGLDTQLDQSLKGLFQQLETVDQLFASFANEIEMNFDFFLSESPDESLPGDQVS
jgi:hypothetical protein